jgi:serine/threonine-protein kinase RsbT
MIKEQTYEIIRELDVAMVTLAATNLAERIGFTKSTQNRIAIAVSELATNLIHHAGSGTITLSAIYQNNQKGIEILVEDSGPGIQDVEKAFTKNFSTRDSLGLGLTAVKQLMDEVKIDTKLGQGTSIVVRKWFHEGAN